MKVKRLFSLLLALTMAMSLLGGICLTASAEVGVPVVEVSDIPLDPEIGETIKKGEGIVPEGAGYTVAYEWAIGEATYDEEYGYSYGWNGISEGVIEDGNDYWFIMIITVDDSWAGWEYYVPGEDLEVQVNINGGEKIVDSVLLVGLQDEFDGDVIVYDVEYLFSEEVNKVEITGAKPAVAGEIASVEGISVPENAPYSIDEINWLSFGEDTMRKTVTGEEFLPGQTYYLEVRVIVDDGYHFTEDCAVYVNGEKSGYYVGMVDRCVVAMPSYSTYDIATVEFSYSVSPAVGKNAAEAVTVTVPENVNYQVTAYWREFDEENWEYVEVDVFEEGKSYELILNVHTIGAYEFTEDTSVIINGELLDSSEYALYWNLIYPFLNETFESNTGEAEPVEPNEISYVGLAVQAPVAGEPLDDSVNVWTVGCTAELSWYVLENEAWQPASGTAEKGKEYMLDITLTADEGYSFAEEIQIWLDGEYSWRYSWGGNTVEQSFWYDTFEVIESVEITSTDKGELGAAATTDGVSVPEGANYSVSAYWGVLNMDEGLVPFEGVFADNTVYAYVVNAEPAEGYKFAEELTVTYNGEPVSEDFCYYDNYTLEVIGEVFTGTMQKVRKVEINARFKAGMKASDAVVEVPEDAPYEITEYYWVDVETGDELTGKFVAGKQYGLMTYITPKAGYVIDLGAQAMVNGTEDYEFINSVYEYVYGYTAVILDCESSDTNGNPSTGDDSELMLPVVLMILSVIGLASVVMTPKKRYR